MYSLPSTSRKREPWPDSTNSGYGVHPDQVARAVLLTPPGMTRQAASKSLALPRAGPSARSQASIAFIGDHLIYILDTARRTLPSGIASPDRREQRRSSRSRAAFLFPTGSGQCRAGQRRDGVGA